MSRFSPTQRASDKPGGLGALAQALQQGIMAYEGQQDRTEGRQRRDFAENVQRGGLLERGITVDEAPAQETFGGAFTRALSGAPAPQPVPTKAPAPGAFKAQEGEFEQIDPVTGQPKLPVMRSGGAAFDPNVGMQRGLVQKRAEGEMGLALGAKGREMRKTELSGALQTVPGAPAGAAFSEGASADWLGRPPQRPSLRLGDPGYAAAMAEVAAERYAATGGGQNRPPTEVESKDYIFAGLMEDSMDAIREFSPTVRPEVITALRVDPTGLSKIALTEDEQLYVQAVRQFAAAALRKESGAAIQPFEISDMFDRYVDTGFDQPRVRARKAQSRENYLNLLRRTSQRARNYYDRISPDEKPTTAFPSARKEDFMPKEND